MEILLSLITSGSLNYIVILILALGLSIALYKIYINSLDNERTRANQENTIRELNEIVKQKDEMIQQTKEIYEKRNEVVNKLLQEREFLEEKIKELEKNIDKKIASGQDRPASNVLKDLFKSLSDKS